MQVRLGVQAVRLPDACSTAAIIVDVEPLPLVPPTWIVGYARCGSPSSRRTRACDRACTTFARETVSSIVPSKYASACAKRRRCASSVGDAAGEQFERVRQHGQHDVERLRRPLSDCREDSRSACDARTPASARESIAVFTIGHRRGADRLGDAGHLVVENRRGRLRRAIARAKSRSAAGENQIGRAARRRGRSSRLAARAGSSGMTISRTIA